MSSLKPSMSAMRQRFLSISTTASAATPAAVTPWFEAPLLEILLRPVPAGTARDGHAKKEHEVGALFGRLSVLEAWTLHKRLGNPQTGDVLAAAFGRMIVERQGRLLAFLGDARRRAAIARAA
jgi:hypothetical protein